MALFTYPWPKPLIPAKFLERKSRFSAVMELDGQKLPLFVANSGRMKELLIPGAAIWVSHEALPHRKTDYDLVLVEHGGRLVSVDSRIPNRLLQRALEAGVLEPFAAYPRVKAEAVYGKSRFDFRLEGPQGVCWLEAKSVTLVVEGQARFPDAPTERGTKHLEELSALTRDGGKGSVVFLIQRTDALQFAPNRWTDPVFAEALEKAVKTGVAVYAYRCDITKQGITLMDTVPLVLNSGESE